MVGILEMLLYLYINKKTRGWILKRMIIPHVKHFEKIRVGKIIRRGCNARLVLV